MARFLLRVAVQVIYTVLPRLWKIYLIPLRFSFKSPNLDHLVNLLGCCLVVAVLGDSAEEGLRGLVHGGPRRRVLRPTVEGVRWEEVEVDDEGLKLKSVSKWF